VSFTGEFRHSIDPKGRLIVPSRLRDELNDDRVVLTRWPDGCIAMWSGPGWDQFETRLLEQSRSDATARAVVRAIAASAHQDVVDRQGRISVPQNLRDHADIGRDVVVVGALDHGELWSPARWDQQQARVEQERLDELVQQLSF
jgi:MraZ protein